MGDRALIVCSFLIGLLFSFLTWPPNQATGGPQLEAAVAHTVVGPEACRVSLPEVEMDSQASAVVRVLEAASIAGDDIRLEDVACIWGEAELVQTLRHTYIGSAPLLGSERMLTVAVVPLRLRQAGIATDGIQLVPTESGAFTVRRAADMVSGEELAAAVRDALLAAAPAGAEAMVIIEDTDAVYVPVGAEVVLEVTQLPALWHGTSTVSVGIHVDGKRFKTVRVRAQVELYTWALVATTTMRRGDHLDDNNVEMQKVPLASHMRLVSPGDERPLRTTRTVQPGSVIEERFVEPIPDALKGHLVVILAETEGISVSAAGEVLREGNVGELLPVRNLASGTQVVGRLIGPNHVQVQVVH